MRLLEMSISAGVLILLLALLRKGKIWNLTRRTIMLLWMVVLARLLLPGSLPVQNGIAAPVFGLLRRAYSLHRVRTDADGNVFAAIVPEAASSGTADAVGVSLLQAAVWVWMAGAAVTGIYFAYSFWKEYRLLAQALPLESGPEQKPAVRTQVQDACKTACRLAGICLQKKTVKIFVHDRIRTPLVSGIVRQRIVIPKSLLSLEQEQMQYILTHEMVHVRRHDNLWKLLSAAAVCIHWFNPAVWLMYILFARDLELSCDEKVLSVYGSRGRQGYAMTLLLLAQNQQGTTLFCSGFLENPVKERIVAIMKYRKLTGIGVLCAVMLLAGATSVFATNEQTAEGKDAKEQEQVNYSLVTTEDGAEKIEKRGTAKVKTVDENEDAIVLEVDADGDAESIAVKFDGPVNSDSGENYYCYTDEDGVMHVQNAESESGLSESQSYKSTTGVETKSSKQVNSSDHEAVGVDAAEGEEPQLQEVNTQHFDGAVEEVAGASVNGSEEMNAQKTETAADGTESAASYDAADSQETRSENAYDSDAAR